MYKRQVSAKAERLTFTSADEDCDYLDTEITSENEDDETMMKIIETEDELDAKDKEAEER